MLYYPKIPGSRNAPEGKCVAFEKYDGTNLHWDWDRDFGWHAFGTRRDVFNLTDAGIAQFAQKHAQLRSCVDLFLNTLAEGLERVFREPPFGAGLLTPSKPLTEGLQSSSGLSIAAFPSDKRRPAVTRDGGVGRPAPNNEHDGYSSYGSFKAFTEFLGPNSFAGLHKEEDVKELRLFDVLAEPFGMIGPNEFVEHFGHLPSARVVYRGKLTGQFADDVRTGKYKVAEGVICKGGTGGPDVWMVKIKTHAYLDRLKQAFADRWEDYWE